MPVKNCLVTILLFVSGILPQVGAAQDKMTGDVWNVFLGMDLYQSVANAGYPHRHPSGVGFHAGFRKNHHFWNIKGEMHLFGEKVSSPILSGTYPIGHHYFFGANYQRTLLDLPKARILLNLETGAAFVPELRITEDEFKGTYSPTGPAPVKATIFDSWALLTKTGAAYERRLSARFSLLLTANWVAIWDRPTVESTTRVFSGTKYTELQHIEQVPLQRHLFQFSLTARKYFVRTN